MIPAPRLVHVTTTDISLALLLGPQLRAFQQAGYEVLTASSPGPYADELSAAGIPHIPLRHTTRAMAPFRDVRAYRELRHLFETLRPTIVHTHNPKPGIYGRVAARAAGVPVVINTVHGLYAVPGDRWLKRSVVYRLERFAACRSDAELVQNPEDLETLRGLGVDGTKLHLLGNGIDLERFDPDRLSPTTRAEVRAELGIGEDEVLFGAIGRLVSEKGYGELFEAFRSVSRQGSTPVRLVVVGPREPDKHDGLSDAVMAEASASGVVLLGERTDVERYYAAMDAYVLASHREGFPRSAMEAAAFGLPIVATDIRGCRQVVEHDRTGVLVPPRDAPALARAIGALAADPARRRRFGAAARDKARREFDDRRVIDVTLRVYEQLLGTRSAKVGS